MVPRASCTSVEIGASREDKVTEMKTLILPSVRNVLRVARRGVDDRDCAFRHGGGSGRHWILRTVRCPLEVQVPAQGKITKTP